MFHEERTIEELHFAPASKSVSSESSSRSALGRKVAAAAAVVEDPYLSITVEIIVTKKLKTYQ